MFRGWETYLFHQCQVRMSYLWKYIELLFLVVFSFTMIGVLVVGLLLLFNLFGPGLFFFIRRRTGSSPVSELGMVNFKVNCSVPEFSMQEIILWMEQLFCVQWNSKWLNMLYLCAFINRKPVMWNVNKMSSIKLLFTLLRSVSFVHLLKQIRWEQLLERIMTSGE